MGREIPLSEHDIPGRVWIGRPSRPNTVLPPELQESLVENLDAVAALKASISERSSSPEIADAAS